MHEIGAEATFLQEQVDAADADITSAAERLSVIAAELAGLRKEEEILRQRVVVLEDGMAVWRERLGDAEPLPDEMPELPRTPQQPVSARVAVETLRRDRSLLDARLLELRAERDALAAHDPIQLRAELEAAEAARTQAEQTMLKADDAALAASNARDLAAEAERVGRTG